MNKKLLATLLSLILCFTLSLGSSPSLLWAKPDSQSEEETSQEDTNQEQIIIEISSEEEFLTVASNCRLDSYSMGKTFVLTKDLCFVGTTDLQPVPYFNGTFDGQGHTIEMGKLVLEGSDYGLFRYVGIMGTITNLNVVGTVELTGSGENAGGMVGVNFGSILQCSFVGTVSGENNVGAICGVNRHDGKVTECQSAATIVGVNCTGGIVGNNAGIISDCTSDSEVNTTDADVEMDFSTVDVSSLSIFQAVVTRNNMGGIAGNSTGEIHHSTNRGTVGYLHTGYNVGGIAGAQSGRIFDCTNEGVIYGRKDVAGIVGQAIPYEQAQYLKDSVEEIGQSVENMDKTLNSMSASMNSINYATDQTVDYFYKEYDQSSASINEQLESIESGVDLSTEQQQYIDQIKEAQSNAQGAVTPGASQADLDYAKKQWDTITRNLNALNNSVSTLGDELGSISSTLNQTAQTLEEGNVLTDVSSLDEIDSMEGLVSGCTNEGEIHGDLNVGGIAGSVNIEYENDPEFDFAAKTDKVIKTSSVLSHVIMDCRNFGDISSKKNHAGGITGLSEVGLIYNCEGYGNVSAQDGSYAGGISGENSNGIQQCYAFCNLSARSHVGGIAGVGTNVSSCVAVVKIACDGEAVGAVLGRKQEDGTLSKNYYASKTEGAVDGIDYDGGAEYLEYDKIMELENIPKDFAKLRITFKADDKVLDRITVGYGSSLTESVFPKIPDKENTYACWPEASEYQNLTENLVIEAIYKDYLQSVASDSVADNGNALAILTGKFSEDVFFDLITIESPSLDDAVVAYEMTLQSELSQEVDNRNLRILAPKCKNPRIWVSKDGATWEAVDTSQEGSYLSAMIPSGVRYIAIDEKPVNYLVYALLAAFGVGFVILLILAFLGYRKLRLYKLK